MTTAKKYSALIRTVSGVLGILGIVAIGFNAVQEGSIQPSFLLFAKFFAGFIFLYVAFFGTNPLDVVLPKKNDK